MYHQPVAGIHLIHFSSQTGHKNDRKLQSLTLMNGHHADNIGIFSCGICLPEIHFIFLKLIDITQKMKQSPVACFLVINRFFHQHCKICRTALPCWQCRRIISISAKLQNLLDQFMDRQILFFPQLTIHPVKVIKCALRGILHGMHCSFRKRTLRIFHTNLCHLFLIQSHQGRPKNRRHRNILIGIIQNPQHCQHRLYLRCRKISGRRLHICRYPRSLQNLHKIRSVVF